MVVWTGPRPNETVAFAYASWQGLLNATENRNGRLIIPVSNALLFTRGMLTVPAGFADLRDWEFILLSAVGSLLFQTWLAIATLYATRLNLINLL